MTFEAAPAQVIAYRLDDDAPQQKNDLYVIHNANRTVVDMKLPKGKWKLLVDGKQAGTKTIRTVSGTVRVEGLSAFVLAK